MGMVSGGGGGGGCGGDGVDEGMVSGSRELRNRELPAVSQHTNAARRQI